jgi:hypothetical protein
MRRSFVRHTISRLVLIAALMVLGGPELRACSGPGAMRTILESELIGSALAGVAIAIVAGGCRFVRRRSPGQRIRWIVAPLPLHPRLSMDAFRGDCGYGLRWWSLVGTLGIAVSVALAICWPRPTGAKPQKWRWTLSGALAGALAGLLGAALILEGPGLISAMNVPLAASAFCSAVIVGTFVGGGLFGLRTRDGGRFRFSLRTLMLLSVVLAPVFVTSFPVLPYQVSVPTNSFLRLVVVDDATGQPIVHAAVRLIDPRFALGDTAHQGAFVVTGADGRVEYLVYPNIQGREGLLGRTEETDSYDPWLIRVEAAGYRPFFSSMDSSPPILADRLTAPPLGLTYPLPPSVTVRLSPSGQGPRARQFLESHRPWKEAHHVQQDRLRHGPCIRHAPFGRVLPRYPRPPAQVRVARME